MHAGGACDRHVARRPGRPCGNSPQGRLDAVSAREPVVGAIGVELGLEQGVDFVVRVRVPAQSETSVVAHHVDDDRNRSETVEDREVQVVRVDSDRDGVRDGCAGSGVEIRRERHIAAGGEEPQVRRFGCVDCRHVERQRLRAGRYRATGDAGFGRHVECLARTDLARTRVEQSTWFGRDEHRSLPDVVGGDVGAAERAGAKAGGDDDGRPSGACDGTDLGGGAHGIPPGLMCVRAPGRRENERHVVRTGLTMCVTPARLGSAPMKRAEKAERIGEILDELYPDPPVPLDHTDPYTLVVAVALSAQTTDKKVNEVTPALFAEADTPEKMAALGPDRILELIREIGLAPTKAKNLWTAANQIIDAGGEIIPTFEFLESLAGVGHKTASVVMAQAYDVPAFPVDTHIHRLADRWGLSNGTTVERTEKDLKAVFPRETWNGRHLQIIFFGREYCPARRHDPRDVPDLRVGGHQEADPRRIDALTAADPSVSRRRRLRPTRRRTRTRSARAGS